MRCAAGRVLGLMMVGLLVVSAAGLAASQTFINRTGKTVTGITIKFSRSVTITRHDSAFPDQSPSGRSDEFTFSGRDLRNLGRFSISWMPSSAKVTDYEWVEKAQPAPKTPTTTTQQEEFKLPDPNTPPILYGDDYPGPDEPKYQPASDEQIWLTDLDGHGDIYDNDSIKINYAPGFDVSQITKISVYRNGVYMRFLPEKFGVLTNAQMKTFDGNPAEHTPASNHTDHAIMGYEYEFKISTADHVWILKKTVKSGFRWRSRSVWMRVNGDWAYWMKEASDGDIVKFFQQIRQDGFSGIELDIPYYLMTPFSNEVIEQTEMDRNVVIWNHITPTKEKLDTILKAITQVGLQVHAISMFYIWASYSSTEYNVWKGIIDPRNPVLFFANYVRTLNDILPVLNKYHVTLFTVLDEEDTICRRYPALVDKFLSDLAPGFDGQLGIDISQDVMNEHFTGELNTNAFKTALERMLFFDWGSSSRPLIIEYSLGVPPLETQRDQRTSIMERNFVEFWRPTFDNMSQIYPDNPQAFGEMVTYPADGVGLGLWAYWDMANKTLDKQEAADIWCVYLAGARDLAVDSMNVWTVPFLDLGEEEVLTGFMNIGVAYQQSPAYRVIKAIIQPAD